MNYLFPLYFCLLMVLVPASGSGHEMSTKNGQMELYSIAEPCPEYLGSPHNVSANLIKVMITSPHLETQRVDRGINHLDFDNLELLTSPVDNCACSQLNDFKNHWLKDDELDDTYYKVDNYYFMVRWYNGNMLGFLPVFVFNPQFDLVASWAI